LPQQPWRISQAAGIAGRHHEGTMKLKTLAFAFGLALGTAIATAVPGSAATLRFAFQGEFKSLYDFCERIESRYLNKRVFESLIKSGAVDSLGPRESMLDSVDEAVAALQRASRTRESGQQGRVNVDDAIGKSSYEVRRQKTHVSRKANQINLRLLECCYKVGVMLFTDSAFRGNQLSIQAPPLGRLQTGSARPVGNYNRNLSVKLSGSDRISNGLKV